MAAPTVTFPRAVHVPLSFMTPVSCPVQSRCCRPAILLTLGWLSVLLLGLTGCETPTLGRGLTLAVPPLQPAPHLIEAVFRHGDDVIVRIDPRRASTASPAAPRYWIWQNGEPELRPLRLEGVERILALDESGGSALALVRVDGGLTLLDRRTGAQRQLALPETDLPDAAIATNARQVLIVTTAMVIVVEADGRTWRSALPPSEVTAPRIQIGPLFATDDALLLTFDGGEWGGSVVALPLLAGQKTGAGARLLAQHARAFVPGGDGSVLIICGHNRGLRSGAVFRFAEGRVEPLLEQMETAGAAAPSFAWSAAAADESGGLMLLSDDGIYRYAAPAGVVPLWSQPLAFWYSAGEYDVSSHPVGVATAGGRLLVGTRSTGLIEFERRGAGFHPVRQVNFAAAN